MTFDIAKTIQLISDTHQSNDDSREPQGLYGPRNYIMAMDGKKMRSIFCLMGYGLYREDLSKACDLAYAIELFHNFTLVHDDIMDEAPVRRGVPAVHAKYGINEAILTGDVMLIEVYDRLSRIDSPHQLEIIRHFNQTAREVCEGQSMDMDFETREDVTISEYLKMIELKTAVLLGAALRLGALYGSADVHDQEHLYKFAVNAGVSFQLQDDYLDVYGDPKTFGKKVGGDIIQGKKTYLYLRALDLLQTEDRADFHQLYMSQDIDEDDKVRRVRSVFDELHLPTYCQEAKEGFFNLAGSHLAQVSISDTQKEELTAFARKLMDRSK